MLGLYLDTFITFLVKLYELDKKEETHQQQNKKHT